MFITYKYSIKGEDSWRQDAHSLLCQTSGSNHDIALAIQTHLCQRTGTNRANWIVVVSDLDVDWTITNFDGEKFYLSTCGKRLYVWKRTDWKFFAHHEVSEWTEKEKEEAEEGLTRLVEAAAAIGGGTGAVRDFLKQAMERYDIKVHYLRVASTTKPWMEEPHTYCCLARVHSPHGYMVAVFMPNQKIVI